MNFTNWQANIKRNNKKYTCKPSKWDKKRKDDLV